MRFVVGIVGSSVESTAAIASEAGDLLDVSQGPGLNFQDLELVDFYRGVSRLVDNVLRAAALPENKVSVGSVLCCSVEGIWGEHDKDIVTKCLRDTGVGDCDPVVVVPRGISAYLATFGDRRGDAILLKCGTGAFALALDENQKAVRVGGWGPYSGDDGGAFSIGYNALERVSQEYDGRVNRSKFSSDFCRRLGTAGALELLRWVSSIRERDLLRTSISDLAIVVASMAEQSRDPVALNLLENAADRMSESLETAGRNLAQTSALVVSLQGGLLQNSPALYSAVSSRMGKLWPTARAMRCRYRPVVGTLLYGLEILGLRLVRSRMLASIDGASDEHLSLLLAHYMSEIETEAEECRPQV